VTPVVMHYWQHDGLPSDDARLAAITGLSVARWRRSREPVQAKFADGWKHKRIEAEIAKVDRAFMQPRLAGRNGGIKSGIARGRAGRGHHPGGGGRQAGAGAKQARGERAARRNSIRREPITIIDSLLPVLLPPPPPPPPLSGAPIQVPAPQGTL
jgi:Protein of unknown function (DUF1376)